MSGQVLPEWEDIHVHKYRKNIKSDLIECLEQMIDDVRFLIASKVSRCAQTSSQEQLFSLWHMRPKIESCLTCSAASIKAAGATQGFDCGAF